MRPSEVYRTTLTIMCLTCIFTSFSQASLEDSESGLQKSLLTAFTMFVGIPSQEGEDSQGVLVVPGVVIPMNDQSRQSREDISSYLEQRSATTSDISRKLKDTIRLEKIVTRYDTLKTMMINEPRKLASPEPDSQVAVSVTLLGFTTEIATYKVEFTEDSLPVVDTSVSIPMGQNSVIGGMDGENAPYYFLVIEPGEFATRDLINDSDVSTPQIVEKVNPVYPAECRKGRIQGEVNVECIIDELGNVKDASVLNSPDDRLSQAALDAVKQWRFQPSELNGEPISVYMSLTLMFRLK